MNAVARYLEGKGLVAAVRGQQQAFDAIFTTYNQLQSVKGEETFRQRALRQLRKRAFLILDESHEAGGTRQTGWKSKDQPSVGGRAGFVRELIKDAPGVAYSSATFAKRPEVMDLYGRTDMRLAVKGDLDKLPDAIAKGGVPLQQAVSAMLAESGQYVRRERTFDGVDFLPSTVDVGLHRADAVSSVFRAIRDFDQIKQGAVGELEDDLVAGGERVGNDTSTGDAGIKSTSFSSILWNAVDQMLLSLKVDQMAESAIAAVRARERPVIAVDNTMEAALKQHIAERAIRPGDRVDLTFKAVLRRYLERSREVVVTDEGGNASQHYLSDAELGKAGVEAYRKASKMIDDADLDLTASPIDRLVSLLERNGLRVGEITGRNWRLKYGAGDAATLAERPKDESGAAGRVRAVKQFNDGSLDVLIINRAGSTGLSLHAHPSFGNTARRHMIIGQPAKNIDTFMQMLGRVHRTGQVIPPKYTLLLSNAPAENRPAASLVKKLASLNANVTADRTGAVSFDAPDIMNQVGDEVVAEYLAENEELAEMLGDVLTRKASGAYESENAAAKVSGRMALMPVAEQQRFWSDVVSRYESKIQELDAIGENPLVAKTLDLDAVTKRTMPLFAGDKKSDSPFAGPANLDEVDMKLVGKPFPSDQVGQKVRESLGVDRDGQVAEAGRVWSRRQMDDIEQATADYRDKRLASAKDNDAAARLEVEIQKNLNTVTGYMDRMPPGTPVYVTTPGGDSFEAVVIKFDQRGKPKNPAAAGSWVMHVAVADAARQINIPVSAMREFRGDSGYLVERTIGRYADALPAFDQAASKSRETRFIANGNLLAAYDKIKGGQVIHYTTRDGKTRQGILLPKKFDLSLFLDREPVKFDTVDNVMRFLDQGHELASPDQGLRVFMSGAGRLVLEAPKSKARGAQFTLNPKLLRASAPAEFVSAGNKMRLTIEDDAPRARQVLKVAMNAFGLVSHKDKEAARVVLGMPSIQERIDQMRGTHRAGFVSPRLFDPVAVPVVTVVKAGNEATRGVIDFAVRDLVDRVRQYGTPSARHAADLGEKSINTSKAAMGKLSPLLDRAMTLTGGGMVLARHRALASLQRVTRPAGKNYGVSRIVDAVEGRAVSLNAVERQIIDAIRRLTDATAQMLKANGVQQQSATGWRPFNYIPGGKVFVRHYTNEGFAIVMGGPSTPGWREMAAGIADLNNLPRAQVEKTMRESRDSLLGEGPDAAFRRINAEFTREFQRVPPHVFVQGDMIPVLETFPYLYAKTLAERTAARVGFVKHFGQEVTPASPIARLRRDFLDQNGNVGPLVSMMRALNGVPVEKPFLDAGSEARKIVRAYRHAESLFKSGLLSLSTVQNIPEFMGNVQAFAGAGDLFKAVWALSRHPRATIATLETMGAITKDVANLAFQPGRPFGSAARIISEAGGRVFLHKYINELQEKLAAAVALEKVERMQAGKGNSGDVFDLMRFGWEQADAQRLARGNGTQSEYNRVVRQAGAKLVGNPMTAAERTRMSHNRIYRALVAFEGYAQMQIRGLLKGMEAWVKAMRSGNPRLMTGATVKLFRYNAGIAASGAMAYFLLALATGGVAGLKIAWNEAKEDPWKFLRQSWTYTMFAGPYGAIIRQATKNNSYTDWIRATLPGFLFGEAKAFIEGSGAYRGLEGLEKWAELLERIAPVKRAYDTTVAAVFGLKSDEQKLDAAKRAYWRWRFEKYPPDRFETQREATEDDRKFRDAMRKAHVDILRFREPTANIAKALDSDREPKSLAASLRARLMLSKATLRAKTDEQADAMRQELRARIGEEAYRQIEAHDRVLKEWAEAIMLGDRDASQIADYRRQYGSRLVDLEERRQQSPEGTMERDELDQRSDTINREMLNIRKAPIEDSQRRDARERVLQDVLPR